MVKLTLNVRFFLLIILKNKKSAPAYAGALLN